MLATDINPKLSSRRRPARLGLSSLIQSRSRIAECDILQREQLESIQRSGFLFAEDGTFWLPDNPDCTVRGRLSYGPLLAPALKLSGAITPALKLVSAVTDDSGNEVRELEPNDDSEGFTVHGMLASSPRPVTLVSCSTVGRQQVVGVGVDLEEQAISALHLVRGAHTSGIDEKFTAAKIRVANIDEWASLPGFSVSVGSSERVQLTYERPELLSARTECGTTVQPSEALRRSWPQPTGGHITRECWILVEEFGELTNSQIGMQYLTPIISAMNFCIGAPSPVTSIRLRGADGWCEVWHSNIREAPSKSITAHDVLLPLEVVGIEVIANFIDIARLTGPVAPVLADADSGLRRATLETQVLELTTVAEGIHRSLFDDEHRFTHAEADRIRQLVATALAFEPERHGQVVSGFLRHLEEPNYKTRLRGLAGMAEELLPGVTGKTNRWITLTDRARNSFAHRTQGFLTDDTINEYYAVSQSLRWVLIAVLLVQCDANTEECAKRIRENSRYRQFLRNMKDALPQVFA